MEGTTGADLDIYNGLFAAALGVLFTLIGFTARRLMRRFKTRRLRHFWSPIMQLPLTVVLTEYAVGSSSSERSEIANIAGGGWLISKGSALALAELSEFAKGSLRLSSALSVRGDRSGVIDSDNFIVVGSEANNRVAKMAMNQIRENFRVPFELRWNSERALVEIDFEEGLVLSPDTRDGMGVDYGVVIKATIPGVAPRTFILISGCHMWGSHAAAQAAVSPDLLEAVGRLTKEATDLAFVVRTQVVNGASTGPELSFEGGTRAIALLPLTATGN